MKQQFSILFLITVFLLLQNGAIAQEKLYKNEFPLSDVQLLDGPFKHARDLNIEVLLEYDVDRLFATFRKEAGLSIKAPLFPNWEGLDGHVAGHYLTAMAMNYSAIGNEECKKRMDYIISELKACQEANAKNHPDWGVGYIGGVPNSDEIWSTLKDGDFRAYRSAWVPWYNVHKLYAGLRDAWVYAGDEEAKKLFIDFCDWGINITSKLSDEQMQSMLDTEHGGMNEIFADAYQITGEEKYLVAAKRFSHNMLLDAMADNNDNLDNKHANTQVPKAIGFQRIGELANDQKYNEAGSFFWETVTGNRTVAFGGNSRREFFPSAEECIDFVHDVEGPESCNTYNMLRLTEGLFRVDPQAKYADFYEKAMYNHILSTQHPEHGGYVYFTPVRPRHYRVYSAPNEAMWCCVGSGMENHGKYNQFIYTHSNDELYLNLFVASALNWKEKGIKFRQETQFPYEEQTKLTVTEGSAKFKLMIRYPSWVEEGKFKIKVNGKKIKIAEKPSSYVAIDREWKTGDIVEIQLPMHATTEQLPNVSNYIAINYGPVLLGAKTGTEDLRGLVADDHRWAHIAGGERLPIDKAPIIIEDNQSKIADYIVSVKGEPLTFKAPKLKIENGDDFIFEPFNQIHDARYEIYWMTLTNKEYRTYIDSIATVEAAKLALQKRTVDFVAPGEQQPEADHLMKESNSRSGNTDNAFWRSVRNDGYFSYTLATNSETDLVLMVRYLGAERGPRKFDILIDDEKLATVDNTGKWNDNSFHEVEYSIPESMIAGKKNISVKFQSTEGNSTSSIYYIRLIRKEN
ncbi:MAG: glycoside hydrolase family 127 protein [Prolixibacteraceae bacterium]|nr:glycoside hydrolase family 127 protein [Prolixibacteraceae bacterium]